MWDEPRGFERAQQDIREGRLWKARDRLTGLLATFPANQKGLNLLGEVYFRMGDLPEAGRYWYLTDRQGPEVDAALEALAEKHGSSTSLARAIPIRAPLDLYPPLVRQRLGGDLFPLLHPQAWSAPPPKLPRGGYVRRPVDPLEPPFRRTKLGDVSSALGGATAAVVVIGGWIFGAIWVSEQSNGFVWIPILIVAVLAFVGGWIDSRIRLRRLEKMQSRIRIGSDADGKPG